MALTPIGSRGLLTITGVDPVGFVSNISTMQAATDAALAGTEANAVNIAKAQAGDYSDDKDALTLAAANTYADGKYGAKALTQENLNGVTTVGTYYQVSNADATLARNYPVAGMGGSLINLPVIPDIGRTTQLFILNHWAGTAMYVRSFNGSAWSPWSTYQTQAVADGRYFSSAKAKGIALGQENLNGLTETATYYQTSNANATAERNYPVPGMSCTIVNLPLIPDIGRFTQLAVLNHWVGAAMYVRSFNGSAWSPWQTYMTQSSADNRYYQKTVLDPILAGMGGSGGGSAPADAAEHEYRLSALRGKRGPVKITTPAAVVLAFDHGLANFKSIVHPMLVARDLPVTLAVNSQLFGDAQNAGVTNADVASWAAGPLVEIANHGRTHTFPADLETEIRGGREELEAIIGQPIDTYVQAGITGDTWGGTYADVAGTQRGKVSYSAHAILSGVMPSATLLYPLDGHPSPGTKGSWIDNGGAQITAAQSKITQAVAAEKFTIIRFHPEHIDGSGRITTAALASFLDWIVAERDAGRITVLQLRDASIATHAA